MKITKEYSVELGHLVPNASSYRCSHSTHGHSYRVLITLEGRKMDFAGMLYDFGLLKGTAKDFIDSMDHCIMFYNKAPEEYQNFFRKNNDRWIEVPFIPSAEMMSVFILHYINVILYHTKTNNGEGDIKCTSVRVFETRTGSAECDLEDEKNLWKSHWVPKFSDGVLRDWGEDLKKIMFEGKVVANPVIKQQVPYIE